MFVAYLVPQQDLYLVAEDGLGLLALGSTRERAIEKLRKQFYESWYCPEDPEDPLYDPDAAKERDAEWAAIVAETGGDNKLFVIEETDED